MADSQVSFQNLQIFQKNNVAKERGEAKLAQAKNAFEIGKIAGDYQEAFSNATDNFSLMSAGEATKEKSYNKALSIFSKDEIASKDTDSNKKLDRNEYLSAELKELEELKKALKEEVTPEEKAQTMAKGSMLFSLIDTSNDEVIKEKELKTFYSEMDSFIEGELNGDKDGVLDMDQINNYKNALINSYYSEDFQKELETMFLEQINKYAE